jgi:two-component system, OmpR family, phosphate regulon sensor histidine kinase PhoR
MNRYTIRLLVILATIAITGIITTQVFWLRRAFDLKEKQFNQTVNIALKSVAEQILAYNQHAAPVINPVCQYSTNYFVVAVNDVIDANVLEYFLRKEFSKRNVTMDFEYGIYDCNSERMVYGNYVNTGAGEFELHPTKRTDLPKWENKTYYFGVNFPTRENHLLSQMGIWGFSSFVLLVMIVFFAYALFVILKQKRLSEIQRDFINNMTHEFKTPISTIAISSEVLKNPSIIENPGRLLNYATIIQEQACRLKNQVETVLQMATIDKEQIKLKKEPVDVHEVIHKAVENIEALLKQQNGSITYELQATESIIHADRLHLTNIIYNLLDNAIKYSTASPQICVLTRNEKKGIWLSIRDNGIGISKEHQKKILDKFYRVPTGNVHDVKGFGLGLNYIQSLVKAHKGYITLLSELHQGSTFSIFLPSQ